MLVNIIEIYLTVFHFRNLECIICYDILQVFSMCLCNCLKLWYL